MIAITRPTLLLNEAQCKRNIQYMVEKAKRLGVGLVPHFKTHQSKEIGEWFREVGIYSITVSSVKMAEFFASCGWKKITIAFPLNVLEIPTINALIEQGVELYVFVVEEAVAEALNKNLKGKLNVFLELDAGYGRCGLPVDDLEAIMRLAEKIEKGKNTELYGLYCHPGNTYQADSIEEIRQIWATVISKVGYVKAALTPKHTGLKVRVGDTPGCTVVENMDGVDEIGPGNFVFYDLVMNYLNVCSESEIAVAMACPIVAKNEDRSELVIHGGAVHFSKDHLFDEHEQKFFGEVVILEEEGWSPIIEGIKLVSLSQEHGILKASAEIYDTLQVGDVIGVLPIHSCLTANLMKRYTTFKGEEIRHLESF